MGCILSEGGAQGASSSRGPRAAPLAPAALRLGAPFSRYVLDFSDKPGLPSKYALAVSRREVLDFSDKPSLLSDYVPAASLRDRLIAERDLFEAGVPRPRAVLSEEEDACVGDYYARVVGEAERNVATLASLLPGTRWEDVSSIAIDFSEYVAALAKLERLG